MIPEAEVLDCLGDAVVTVDAEGRVGTWSAAAEPLLGWSRAEAAGRRLAELGLAGLLPAALPAEARLALRRRDGADVQVVVTSTPLGDGGRALLVKDLTRWIGPAGTATATGEDESVNELLGLVLRDTIGTGDLDPGEGFDELAARLADQGRRLLPGIECAVLEVLPGDETRMRVVAGAGPFAESTVGRVLEREGMIIDLALRSRRVIENNRLLEESAQAPLMTGGGIQTARVVPMNTGQPLPDGRRDLGVISFMRRSRDPFTAPERRLLDVFAQLANVSLQRAEFRAAAERTTERLQLAVDVAFDLAQSLDVREVVRRLIVRAMTVVAADRCVLLRIQGGDTVVEDAQDAEGREDLIGFRQRVREQPLMERAVRTQAPVLGGAYDVSALPQPLAATLAEIRHTATVPLTQGGVVAAVLVLSRRADLGFQVPDIDTLRMLGNVAVLALRNSWLFGETQDAARVKSDFLSMAAHELRTPLTVVTGYLSMLDDGSFGPRPAQWEAPLGVLTVKAGELSRLVEDLLLAARLETGRLPSYLELVDLRDVVRQVAQDAAGAVEVGVPEAPVRVLGQPDQLQRALRHLVANALVHTRPGQPAWVRLELLVDVALMRARVVVSDRGRGIAAAHRAQIFERFYRVDDREQSPQPGTGLGLYIARELAERHQGSLELEWSQPGSGSRFVFTVPLE